MTRLNNYIYGLVLLFPIVLLAIKPLGMIIFALLSIIGIFLVIKEKKNPFKTAKLKLFSWLTIGYFSAMVISVWLSNEATNSWIHLSRISHFLFAPLVAVSVMQVNVSLEELSKSFKVGIIIAGLISMVGFISAGGIGRFSGMYNPNTFGDLAVLMLFFSISCIIKEDKRAYILSLMAVFFGVTAVILSASRGSMISLALLLPLYILLMYRSSKYHKKRIWIIVLLFMMTAGINMFGMHNTFSRLGSIQTEVAQWEDTGKGNTSAGARLEMYSAGLQSFLDAPLIGYGYHNCGVAAARYASQEDTIQKDFEGRWHLHNEFITTLVNAGVLGLGTLFALYFIPLFIFIKRASHSIYASIGVIFIIGYILLGVTHTLFGYAYETAFFVFTLAYIFTKISTKDTTNV
jgi:O-antigen ligase